MYFTILTDIGKAKLANATALGQTVNLTQIAVGDGNGTAVTPTQAMTDLVNQVWIGNVSDLRIDEAQNNWIVAESYIASDIGGFTVREVGLFDDVGDLIAVGNYPDSYKPVFASGAAKDMLLRIIIEVSNADTVELLIDPAIILATREYVDNNAMKKLNHVDMTFVDSGYKILENDHVRANSVAGIIVMNTPISSANAYFEFNTGNSASINKIRIDANVGDTLTFGDVTDTFFEVNTNSKTFGVKYDLANKTWRIN